MAANSPDMAARLTAAAATVAPSVLVLMGVSGSGKSTVAQELQPLLGWPFQEGDDLHPPANVEKMRSGQPLDDQDRMPWLAAVAGWIDGAVGGAPAGHHHLLRPEARLSPHHDRRPAGRDAGLPERRQARF